MAMATKRNTLFVLPVLSEMENVETGLTIHANG
jgi:hypothetical protein